MNLNELQIVTITYNHEDYIESYFQSFIQTFQTIPCNIYIADNNSEDNTYKVLQKWQSQYPNKIFLQKNSLNIGFSKANNQLTKLSESKYLLFLNPDISFSEDFLTPSLQILSQKNIALSPSFLDTKSKKKYKNYDSFYDNPYYSFHKLINKVYQAKSLHKVDWIQAACLFIQRESFNKVNGFNEQYFVFTEDMYLAKKLKEQNIDSFINPSFKVFHPNRVISKQQFKMMCKNLNHYHQEYSIDPYLIYLKLLTFFSSNQINYLQIWKQIQNEKQN